MRGKILLVLIAFGWSACRVSAQEQSPPILPDSKLPDKATKKKAADKKKVATPEPPPPEPTYSGTVPKTMAPNAGTPDNTAPAGFVALFNGKDLAGWKGLLDRKKKLDNPAVRAKLSPEEQKDEQAKADDDMKAHWKAEGGEIVFDGKGQSLCTQKLYTNFEMWVDWKIGPTGDSGIYLRGSPQVQIWDLANPNASVGSGGLYNNKKNPTRPLVVADKPVGQWNTFFIRMVGDKVTVYLNGQLVVDNVVMENYWDRSQPIFPKEQIELQNHSHELYFKNIYLKELP